MVDGYRRKRRSQSLTQRYRATNHIDLIEKVEDADLARRLEASLARLPHSQREVLQALSNGESVRDFAARRGCSVRAAEGHLRRARKCMRRVAASA